MNKELIFITLSHLLMYAVKLLKFIFKMIKYTLLYTLACVIWMCMHVIAFAYIRKQEIHDSLNEAAKEVTDDGATWAATDTRLGVEETATLHDAG